MTDIIAFSFSQFPIYLTHALNIYFSISLEKEDKKKMLYAEKDISKPAVIKSNNPIAGKYVMCVAAVSVEEGVMYPLDSVHFRLQIQGEIYGQDQVKCELGTLRRKCNMCLELWAALRQ